MIREVPADQSVGISRGCLRRLRGEQEEPGILDATGGEHETVSADGEFVTQKRADPNFRARSLLDAEIPDGSVQYHVDVFRLLQLREVAMREVLRLNMEYLIAEPRVPGE
jgi:hypothetical protein